MKRYFDKDIVRHIVHCLVLLAMGFFIVVFLPSCATKKEIQYVDREVVKYVNKVQHDTLIKNTHDSVYIEVEKKGDTVYVNKYKIKKEFVDKIVYRTDTCYKDSVLVKNAQKIIEKYKIPKWCYFCLFFCLIFVIFAIIKLLKWLRTL